MTPIPTSTIITRALVGISIWAPLASAQDDMYDHINCSVGASNDADWTNHQKNQWCCKHLNKRCFDCDTSYSNWEAVWSAAKKEWCCRNEQKGCLFNCSTAYNNWEKAWSGIKKDWCCRHEELGCPEQEKPFDCQKDYHGRADWPVVKREWCCVHEQLGCYVPTTTPLPTTTTKTSSTTPGFVMPTLPLVTLAPPADVVTEPTQPSDNYTGLPVVNLSTAAAASPEATETTCFQEETSWEPLDMPGNMPVHTDNSSECQKLCAKTDGCVHFSYWWVGKHCHLEDAYSVRQPARLGFVSGPFSCWDNLDHTKYIKKDDDTFVHNTYKCVDLGTQYEPLMGLIKHFPREGSSIEAVKACRAYCANTKGCLHWTMVFPHRLCRMAGANAHKLTPYIGAVSGSPTCWGGEEHNHSLPADRAVTTITDGGDLEVVMKTALRNGLPTDQRMGGTSAALVMLLASVAILGGAVVALHRARTLRMRYGAPVSPSLDTPGSPVVE